MSTIPQVSQAMQTLLTSSAETVGALIGFIKRPDKALFSASSWVQTLVWGWLAHPNATLEQLTQMAVHLGVDVSPQALDQRFTPSSAALLEGVLRASIEQLVASQPLAIPLLARFNALFIQDSTTISLPDALKQHWAGCGGSSAQGTQAALKCGLQFDLLTGAISHLDLADGRTSDHNLPMQHSLPPPGSLRLADLGFFDLSVFCALDAAGSYFLSKTQPKLLVSDEQHQELSLYEWIKQQGQFERLERWVWLGQGRRLRARILLSRVPQEVADQRRRRIRAEAKDKGRMPSAAALALADWTILITNLPEEMLSLEEALVLMRVRWQIELLFKLWKSQGQIDCWRSRKPYRILSEIYAKLIAMVLQHWLLLMSCWSDPERSLVKAASVVREHALELASGLAELERLNTTIETIQRVLKRTAKIAKRKAKPSTYQLLLSLTTIEAEA